jgi:hypothetical protein
MKRKTKFTKAELMLLSEAILNEKKKVDMETYKLLNAYVGDLYNIRKVIEWLSESNMCGNYDFQYIHEAVTNELPRAENLLRQFKV